MLGAACIILCLFLIFQMNNKGPSAIITKGPYEGMKRDPLLDRMSLSAPLSPDYGSL
jgi:mannosyltransferase